MLLCPSFETVSNYFLSFAAACSQFFPSKVSPIIFLNFGSGSEQCGITPSKLKKYSIELMYDFFHFTFKFIIFETKCEKNFILKEWWIQNFPGSRREW